MAIKMYRLYINEELHPDIYERLANMSRALRGDFIRDAIQHYMASDSYPGKRAPESPTSGPAVPAAVVRKIAGKKTRNEV